MGLSSSPSNRKAIVLVRYSVRLKIVDPISLDQHVPIAAASELDILLRRAQKS